MESGVRPRINRHAIYEWHSDTYTSFNIPSFGIRFSYAIDAFHRGAFHLNSSCLLCVCFLPSRGDRKGRNDIFGFQ